MSSFLPQNDLFDTFRFPHKRSVLRWVLLTLQLFLVASVIVGIFHIKYVKNCSFWKAEFISSNKELCSLQERVKRLGENKTTNKTLKKKWGKFEKSREESDDLVFLLQEVSRLIPSRTWLETLVFVYDSKRDVKRSFVELKGCTPSHKEILAFYAGLSKLAFLNNCSLKYHHNNGHQHNGRHYNKNNLEFEITAKHAKVPAKL